MKPNARFFSPSFKNQTKAQLKALCIGLLACCALGSANAANNPPPTIKADAPNRYVVKKGDTLWDISGKYLNSPWRWREIWAVNQQVRNPNLIYPNDVLILCVVKGKTLVGIDTGTGCAGVEQAASQPAVDIAPAPSELAGSIPTIPLTSIESWLSRTVIVSPDDFNTTPYVLASKNKNIITGAGDTIYAKGVPLILGQHYGVYRAGQPYVDPTTRAVIGLEVTQVASGKVTDVASNGVSSLRLTASYGQEVREGDRVFVEVGNYLPPMFHPRAAQVSRGGRVIRIMDALSSVGRDGVVAINLGSRQGAQAGDVLSVYQKGATVQDNFGTTKGAGVRLPSEEIGHVMVFKTFDNISYAYVLDAESPIRADDYLMSPRDQD